MSYSGDKRILLLITDLQIGGTPTVVYQLATRLSKAGAHVEVACLSTWGPVATQLRDAGVTVTALNAAGPTDLRVLAALCRLIEGHQVDTLFSFLVHANAMASMAAIRTGVRHFQSIQTTQPDPPWHWAVQRLVHPLAERIVVPSPSVAEVAEKWSHVPAEKIVVIPNAIDPADFSSIRPIENARPFPIGFIGRLDPIKRLPDLVDAAAQLGERVHLHIFGQGPEQPALELQIAQFNLQDRATLHGAVASPQEALSQMGLLVLPSAAEGFGLVLIEAMAGGIPVVATDVPGIRDVVKPDRTGLLVPPCDPRALAGAIRRLLDDPALRKNLTTQAREDVARRFTWQQVLPQYQALLAQL